MQSIEARVNKWKMHRFFAKNSAIAKYLPPTKIFTLKTLTSFMGKYKKVYIKANMQHTGKGIVKAWKSANGYRFVKIRGKVNSAASVTNLYHQIKKAMPIRSIIVQKAIDLPEIKGRFFDIRVMMMRDSKRRWQYAGMVVKVAGQGSVISNVRRGGGYVMTIENALRKSLNFNKDQVAKTKRKLIELSRNIILYSEKYPFFSYQSGIDLAVDKNGRIWIIEVNLHDPSHGLFNKLSDKTFYKRIGKLYRSYRKHNKRVI
jgi:uncharacterized circularly permuted ATP-grasp superfamily protein